MKHPALFLLPAIALLINSGVREASAAEIYVNHSASFLGNGTAQWPYATLQEGINAAGPGDVVRVAAGEYGAIRTVRHGAPDARISIRAEARRKVFVNVDGRALEAGHRYHTFDGIVFDGGYGDRQVVRTDGADHLELLDTEVRHGTKNCIDLGSVRNVLIADSRIHHCINIFNPDNNADSHGITGNSVFDLTVRNTEIFLVTGDALQLSPARMAWGNVRVEGCRLWAGKLDRAVNGWAADQVIGENAIDTKVGATVLNGSGARPRLFVVDTVAFGWRDVISNQAAYNVKEDVNAFFDRVTVFDSDMAFRLRAPAHAHVQNAVIYDVDYAFRLEDGIRDATIVYSTLGDGIAFKPFRVVAGKTHNLTLGNLLFLGDRVPQLASADPSNTALGRDAFVDASGNDYRLRQGAAAVDSGVLTWGVPWDRDGLPRPQGDRHDIGAYERAPLASHAADGKVE